MLLVGSGRYQEEPGAAKSLRDAGWTHVVAVEAVDAPHLDKTARKRHRRVFTKLRALETPYQRVLLLDLDILPRDGRDLTVLFEVPAPAGKYHPNYWAAGFKPRHGELLPPEAQESIWCPNTGVVRLDPQRTADARRAEMAELLDALAGAGEEDASYLPDQYFLAQRLTGWRHIGECFNLEVALGTECLQSPEETQGAAGPRIELRCDDLQPQEDLLSRTYVWHYSGKAGLQPWMFQDVQGPLAVKTWLCQHYGVQDPNVVIATAFMEWRQALDDFLKFADIAEDSPTAVALSSLALCAEGDRTCCDRGRARHLAGRAMETCCSLAGRRLAGPAHEFDAFAMYYRTWWDPGPLGDAPALEYARRAWSLARVAPAVKATKSRRRSAARSAKKEAEQLEAWLCLLARASLLAEEVKSADPTLQGRRRWQDHDREYTFADFVRYYSIRWDGTPEGYVAVAKLEWESCANNSCNNTNNNNKNNNNNLQRPPIMSRSIYNRGHPICTSNLAVSKNLNHPHECKSHRARPIRQNSSCSSVHIQSGRFQVGQ